jgi:hypothetical protein
MKIAELDWQQVLAALRKWNTLPVEARRAYVAIKAGAGITRAQAGDGAVDALVAAGLLERASATGRRYAVPAGARPVHVLLRAMDRVRVLEAPGELPHAYLTEHFSDDQTSRLAGEAVTDYRWGPRGRDAELVSSVDWVQPVLSLKDADAARRWEQPRRVPGEESSLAVPWTLAALQRLIPRLAEHPAGVPAAGVDALLPELGPAVRADAVRAGIRYLLVFPSLHGPGLEARIGLLPVIARRLGSPSAAPKPVQVEETFDAPFRLTDMTTVLVEAATEPVPVRGNDGGLYVRAAKAIAARFPGLPAWVADVVVKKDRYATGDDGLGDAAAAQRIAEALRWLQAFKLAAVERGADRYRLTVTKAGRRWLAAGEGDRLKEILAALRASPQRNPDGAFSTSALPFFPSYLGLSIPGEVDLRRALTAALLSLPEGTMVELYAFAVHHGRERNPFLAPGMEKLRHRMVYGRGMTREMWESAWSRVLLEFVAERLVPFGGARLGAAAGDRVVFGVTDAGRYLLGDAEDFDYAPAPEGDVLVQPDFEIVFLAPAPRVEAELGRFAERTGAGVGALFRITRASVLRAAEQGVTADALLGTLEAVSRSGVPANVARQVRDWIGGTRRVTVKPAVLVECPDPETAGRVRSLGGAMVTEITPTVLRLDAHARERAALVKKLRDKGIFVAE